MQADIIRSCQGGLQRLRIKGFGTGVGTDHSCPLFAARQTSMKHDESQPNWEAQEAVTNAPLADKARIAEQYHKYSLIPAKLLLQCESLEQS